LDGAWRGDGMEEGCHCVYVQGSCLNSYLL
jgi:hypothetical protein